MTVVEIYIDSGRWDATAMIEYELQKGEQNRIVYLAIPTHFGGDWGNKKLLPSPLWQKEHHYNYTLPIISKEHISINHYNEVNDYLYSNNININSNVYVNNKTILEIVKAYNIKTELYEDKSKHRRTVYFPLRETFTNAKADYNLNYINAVVKTVSGEFKLDIFALYKFKEVLEKYYEVAQGNELVCYSKDGTKPCGKCFSCLELAYGVHTYMGGEFNKFLKPLEKVDITPFEKLMRGRE